MILLMRKKHLNLPVEQNCQSELSCVNEYIIYSIDIDGAINELSGYLEGGFSYCIEVKEVYLCGNVFPHNVISEVRPCMEFDRSIRQLILFDLARGKTIPVKTTDKDISFHKKN